MSAVVGMLTRLIAARSHNPQGNELTLAELLHDELASADHVEILRLDGHASVLATFGTPRLLVNAHLDTVPPNSGWSADPFVARVENDRVIGLGAADIKGAIAAILCALSAARPQNVAILFSGDEEAENTCMRRLLADRVLPSTIERAIVCEPTSLRVGTRHRGITSFNVTRVGEGGHSSRADHLPRPIADLARVAVALDEWRDARTTVGPPGYLGTCLNLAQLEGGVAFNVIPSQATLKVSIRPAPGADVAAMRAELSAIVAAQAPEASLAWGIDNAPFATRDREVFRSLLGERIDAPIDLGFWTEAALLSRAGIDAVVIGPGDIAQAHAPDEWVPVSNLEAACAMFTKIFEESRGAG